MHSQGGQPQVVKLSCALCMYCAKQVMIVLDYVRNGDCFEGHTAREGVLTRSSFYLCDFGAHSFSTNGKVDALQPPEMKRDREREREIDWTVCPFPAFVDNSVMLPEPPQA